MGRKAEKRARRLAAALARESAAGAERQRQEAEREERLRTYQASRFPPRVESPPIGEQQEEREADVLTLAPPRQRHPAHLLALLSLLGR